MFKAENLHSLFFNHISKYAKKYFEIFENISDQNLIDIINWYENKSDFKINEVE